MDDLQEMVDDLLRLYNDIKYEIKRKDKPLYERWKAGGYLIDSNIVSMYPNLEQVMESLEEEEEIDDDEE